MDQDPVEKLHTACSSGTPQEVVYLTKRYPGIINEVAFNETINGNLTALHLAVERSQVEIIKVLLENGAKPDICDSEGYTALQIACSAGNLAIVELLLRCGANPDLEIEHLGSTTLHEAVISGSFEVVKVVYESMKKKECINAQDTKGWAPLHYASQNGQTAIVEFLLKNGAKFDSQISSGRSALHLAAFEGHVDCAKLLLERGCKVDTQDDEGWTAVILASQEGHPEIVRLICQRSPNLALSSKIGRNALHSACFHGHIEVVKHLMDAGGSKICNKKDIDGWTALHLAAQEGFKEIVELLLTDERCSSSVLINGQANNGRTPIHNAALKGRENVVKFLIAAKAKVNVTDTKGWTPLHVASQHGHYSVAKLLVGNEARINDTIESGRNALHLAAFEGYFEIAELLVEKGINCSLQDRDKWSPLHLCVQEGHDKIVELLMTVLSVNVNVRAYNNRIPLHSACFHGRTNIAKMLLNRGSQMEAQDEKGWTPLHLCAQEGHLEITKEILSRKLNVNIQASNLRQPIHLACMKGHTEIVRSLIMAGAEIHRGDSKKWTPLCIACQHNHLSTAVLLIEEGADVNVEIEGGRNPIHLAAFDGYYDICKLLKSKGAELNHQDSDGWSCLHLAAQEGFLKVVQLLVEGGADVTASSSQGRKPIHMASSFGHLDIVNFLLKQPLVNVNSLDTSSWTPLHSACNKGHLAVAKALIDKGADLNQLISLGRNCLHLCAFNGHPETAAFLLEKGIDFSVHDNDGWTSMHLAAQEGHLEIVQILLEKGADPSVVANNGRTPLHSAASFGHTEIIKLILKYFKAVDQLDDGSNWTALHCACNKGHVLAVQVLLENGADVHKVINSGRNCLHLAAFNGATSVCSLLLKQGCDLDAKDQDGWTPLHLAGQEGRIDTVKLLLENGAKTEQLSNDGRTPLQLSCLKGHSPVVQKLIQYGSKCDVADTYNYTPLIDASAGGFLELVDLLIENGAKLDVQTDDNGETALHQSLLNKFPQVARYLVLSGANINIADKNGKTPLDLAKQEGYKDLVDEMTYNKSRTHTREEKTLKVKVPPIKALMKFKSQLAEQRKNREDKETTLPRALDYVSQVSTSGQAEKDTEKYGEEDLNSTGVTGVISVNEDEVKSIQKLIETRYHEKPQAKGMIFIVGISGAAGTDVDVENISKTFRDGLNFATFREENVSCTRLASIVKAAATVKYPLKCNYIAFYFAGHGGIDEHHRPFLQTAKSHSSNAEILLIHDNILNQFKSNFSKTRRKKLIFFFDCCLSLSKSDGSDKHFSIKAPVSCLLAYATSMEQKSIGSSKTGGAWTNRLCGRVIEKISLSEILEKVNEDLRNEGFDQVPHYESSTGPVYLNGKMAVVTGHQSTLKLHRPALQKAVSANGNTLIAVAVGLCYGNIINTQIKEDVIRARNNDGASILLDCLEVIVNEKPMAMGKIFEVLEHEQTLVSVVKIMKEEEERKKKAAYEVAGIQDVVEEYRKLEKKNASEVDQIKKELALVTEKVLLIEKERKPQFSLDDQLKRLTSQLEEVEKQGKERERAIERVQVKYRKEMDQLNTEYKMKMHALEEKMQKECTDIFANFNSN